MLFIVPAAIIASSFTLVFGLNLSTFALPFGTDFTASEQNVTGQQIKKKGMLEVRKGIY